MANQVDGPSSYRGFQNGIKAFDRTEASEAKARAKIASASRCLQRVLETIYEDAVPPNVTNIKPELKLIVSRPALPAIEEE